MIFEHAWNPYFISFHAISGLWQVECVLMAIAFFFAFMMLIGYRTQLFTFLSWLMLLSIHNRNILILQGGDDLLRLVLFWAIFIPWGNRYSCDKLKNDSVALSSSIQTVALFAYLLQICYIYTGSALLKGSEWNSDFTALYYTYSLDQIAYPITKLIYHYPLVLNYLTRGAYFFELLIPCLFFIPTKHSFFRALAVFAIIIFHCVNFSTLFIGFFPAIGVSTALGMLPTFIMNKFDSSTSRIRQSIMQAFLAIAEFVNKMIKWRSPDYALPNAIEYTKSAILIFLIVFVFDWNFSNLSFVNSKLSDNLKFIGYGLRLDQSWGMFAPNVLKEDGWYILEGITAKNKKINLLNPKDTFTYQKPESIVWMYKNDRWRKYGENYMLASNNFMRGYFCNYSKRIWNEKNKDNQLASLRVIYMSEFTPPDYQYSKPIKNILWECK